MKRLFRLILARAIRASSDFGRKLADPIAQIIFWAAISQSLASNLSPGRPRTIALALSFGLYSLKSYFTVPAGASEIVPEKGTPSASQVSTAA